MKITRILIVDDEPRVSGMVKLALGRRGPFHVREENDPTHAVATARSYKPDLIVLDVDPPWKDGCDVAAEIESDPVLRAVPIVCLSTLTRTNPTARHSGAFTFATPLDPTYLMDIINRVLSGQSGLCAMA